MTPIAAPQRRPIYPAFSSKALGSVEDDSTTSSAQLVAVLYLAGQSYRTEKLTQCRSSKEGGQVIKRLLRQASETEGIFWISVTRRGKYVAIKSWSIHPESADPDAFFKANKLPARAARIEKKYLLEVLKTGQSFGILAAREGEEFTRSIWTCGFNGITFYSPPTRREIERERARKSSWLLRWLRITF